MEEYSENCITLGRTVEFVLGGERLRGRAVSIDGEGGLVVELEGGGTCVLRFGEASISA
jgi:BirA family biotin operon repressor/biotin-[acetyl-CoA-carboxylase] ligase